eukprot:c16071_g1_i1.p2 GENE.c16071_g1_i1~~c16071_g1_i1.p2  ORF type:complete len:239 (+),score=64.82 c16071_g1_i1:587-1303(+)
MFDSKSLHASFDHIKNFADPKKLGMDSKKVSELENKIKEHIPTAEQLQTLRPWLQLFVAFMVVFISWAVLFSPKPRENLKRLGKPLLVQLSLVGLLAVLPVLWWRYIREEAQFYPQTTIPYPNAQSFVFSSSKFLVSTGVCLAIAGTTYHLFPLDLIPEISPRIGRFNDAVAGGVIGFGVAMCLLGYWLGTGNIPSEMDVVARLVRGVFGLFRPWLELVGPIVRYWLNFAADVTKYVF